MRRSLVFVACGVVLCTAVLHAHAKVAVIVARDSPIPSLTTNQAADIFLGKLSLLPGIGMVTPIDQVNGMQVREEFYRKATRKTPAQLTAYWSRLIFTGKGEPPPEAGGTEEVKQVVASNPYAIGYIPASALDGSVRALLILP